MALGIWCLLFAIYSAYCWWIIGFGGAKWIEGWKSSIFIGLVSLDWSAEQIRMYVLIFWLASLLYFVIAIFRPELRLI